MTDNDEYIPPIDQAPGCLFFIDWLVKIMVFMLRVSTLGKFGKKKDSDVEGTE